MKQRQPRAGAKLAMYYHPVPRTSYLRSFHFHPFPAREVVHVIEINDVVSLASTISFELLLVCWLFQLSLLW